MWNIFKKAFMVPYDDGLVYPSVEKAHQAISSYCKECGYSYSFTGDDEVEIDGKPYVIKRGYEIGNRGYGIRCRRK